MTIQTNATDRRALVRAISERLGTEAVYQGAPGFAYIIGSVTVDRAGSVSGDDADLEALLPFLIEQGFVDNGDAQHAEEEPAQETIQDGEQTEALDLEAEDAEEEDAEEGETEDIRFTEISIPADGLSVAQMTNLVYMLYAKQYVLNRCCGEEVLHISESVVNRLKEYTPESPEAFESLLADFKALGDVHGMALTREKFTMTFPTDREQPERWQTYALLMTHILEACKKATRIRPNCQEPENERYVMYAWLLRLGFGGPDFKETRRFLLKRLKGYCAFANDEMAQRHKQKYADLRRIRREVNEEAERR